MVMRRRTNLEPSINHERWLVSYADFVTLLFAFFVVMYSISQVSEQKYRELSETFNEAFMSSSSLAEKNLTSNKATVLSPPALVNMTSLREDILDSLSHIISRGHITLTGDESWTEIAVDAELIFDLGKAQINDEAKGIFLELADTLSSYDNAIAVAGHTDNLPINNTRFSNNWALSSARAVSVVHLLSSHGVKSQRLSAIGYGEFHPIASNNTAIGRSKNRRVVLRVNNVVPKVVDPTAYSMESHEVDNMLFSNMMDDGGVFNYEQQEDIHNKNAITPVMLEDGSLLFTSDPNLPRTNNPVISPSPN